MHTQLQKKFRQIVESKLLPWATGDLSARLVLAQLPLRVPAGMQVKPYPLPPLGPTGVKPSYFILDSWAGIQMCTARFAQIIVILKGEADFRIGAVGDGSVRDDADGRARLLSALAEGTILVVPGGVLQDTGGPHWFHTHPERANCDLFHLQFLPEGIRCSMCSTVGTKHLQRGWLLCHDLRTLALADLLIEELRSGNLHSMKLAQHYLIALLLRAHRMLSSPSGVIVGRELRLFRKEEHVAETASLAPESVFDRASHYIQSHLHEKLSLGSIAAHAYVSSRTLIRIFNSHAGVPVMNYVLQRRMESAHFYLEHSSLPVAEIGRLVGYARADEFSHAFSRHSGYPPRAVRDRCEKSGLDR